MAAPSSPGWELGRPGSSKAGIGLSGSGFHEASEPLLAPERPPGTQVVDQGANPFQLGPGDSLLVLVLNQEQARQLVSDRVKDGETRAERRPGLPAPVWPHPR